MTEAKSVWNLWRGWRGSPKLLVHVANVCIGSVEDEIHTEPNCEFAVWVDDDVERFDSPVDFRDNVTEEALKRFSCLGVRVMAEDDSVAVSVDIARKEHPEHSWLKGVVLLEVATQPRFSDKADKMRKEIAAAVKRGAKGDSQSEIEERGNSPKDAVRAWKAKRRRDRLLMIPIFVLALGFFLWAIWLESGADSSTSIGNPAVLGLGAAVGSLSSRVYVRLLSPPFEISEQTRATRVLRVLYRGVGPAIGAVAAVVLKMAVG